MMRLEANRTWFNFTCAWPDFAVYCFSGREEVNAPFQFYIELVSKSANVDITSLLGTPGCLTISDRSGAKRPVHGLIREMEQLHTANSFTHYRCSLVPRLWFLDRIRDHRIYQKLSVVDIIQKLLGEQGFGGNAPFSFKLFQTYEPREYCVQYSETDLHFITRLCEEEGIYFYFEHTESSHTLCFCDREGGPKISGESTLRFYPGSGHEADTAVISRLNLQQSVNSNASTHREWNFTKPKLDLQLKELESDPKRAPVPPGMKLEQYRYPHLYELRDEGTRYTKLQLDRQLTFARSIECQSDVSRFLPSYTFTIYEHPRKEINAEWWLCSVRQEGEQPGVLEHEAPSDRGLYYRSYITAIPASTRYIPALAHAKEQIIGDQVAIVTGPPGEEIFTDEYGRVKVQFFWDREGQWDDKTTCWIRVSQGWAGGQYGTMAIPRIGHEVIVTFLEGNPDRPLITGRVYHELNKVPYELPANKTRTVFKSYSSPSKEKKGFNELRIEDKANREEIYMRAEKDLNLYVKNNWSSVILADRHTHTKGMTVLQTDKTTSVTLKDDRMQLLEKDDHMHIQGSLYTKIDKQEEREVQRQSVRSESDIVFEAQNRILLKVGKSIIHITPDSIVIDSPMIYENCGNSAEGDKLSPVAPPKPIGGVDSGSQPNGGEMAKPMPPGRGDGGGGGGSGGGGGGDSKENGGERSKISAPDTFATSSGPDTSTTEDEALTPEQADELVKELQKNEDIPFNYLEDCCHARAAKMAEIMNQKGITNKKIWCHPTTARPLIVGDGRGGRIDWRAHVASLVNVKNSQGQVEEMVIDPALGDGPMSKEQWLYQMHGDGPDRNVFMTDNNVYSTNSDGSIDIQNPNPQDINSRLKSHKNAM